MMCIDKCDALMIDGRYMDELIWRTPQDEKLQKLQSKCKNLPEDLRKKYQDVDWNRYLNEPNANGRDALWKSMLSQVESDEKLVQKLSGEASMYSQFRHTFDNLVERETFTENSIAVAESRLTLKIKERIAKSWFNSKKPMPGPCMFLSMRQISTSKNMINFEPKVNFS